MRVIATQDIGPMAADEASETSLYWPIHLHLGGIILPLTLAVLACRAVNRSRAAWWTPLIVLLLMLLWDLEQHDIIQFGFFYGYDALHPVVLYDSLRLLVFASAFLLLLSDKLTGLTPMAAFVYAALILVFAGAFGLFDIFTQRTDIYLLPTGLVYGVCVCATLAALALSGVKCKQQYSVRRFFFWFGIALVPGIGGSVGVLTGLGALVYVVLFNSAYIDEILYGFLVIYILSLITAMTVFLLFMPFLLLIVWVRPYKTRFHGIFRLPGMDFCHDLTHEASVMAMEKQ